MYDTIKLEKSMYNLTGKSFSQALEELDTSAAYADSHLGPAATRALPASLPSYLTKFFTKREARSLAFSSHWEGSA